ncbi:S53 family peptidase [uncultured Shewanella sp.]|uniref:S53 family peptidase n=1 Tax=uncultured Shewanella sp. TaxID=173975 RepID=UPI002612EC98|nr:S53 family peptidase [uncultured Shewanella sp.]
MIDLKVTHILNMVIGLLLLSACSDDNNQVECIAPNFDADGTLYQPAPLSCYTPLQIQQAYGLNTLYDMGLTGTDQHIVIMDNYASGDHAAYFEVFHKQFFPNRKMPELQIDEFDTSYDDGGNLEIAIDIQLAHAIAPDATIHLVLGNISDGDSWLALLKHVVKTYSSPGTLVSMSFGANERDFTDEDIENVLDPMEELFEEGVSNGMTFFASSGDYGSKGGWNDPDANEQNVQYPATSPNVTAVGGTFLQYGFEWYPTSNQAYLNSGDKNPDYFNIKDNILFRLETVWNEAYHGKASTGGSSIFFDIPDWQASVADHIYAQSGSGRGVPDIAWQGSINGGVWIYVNDYWDVVGGTSASSPQVAGFFALVNQYLQQQGIDALGNINPYLYQMTDNNAFNDILPLSQGTVLAGEQVSNQLFEYNDDGSLTYNDIPGYPVTEGWDMTTGFGSPRAQYFLKALVDVITEND